MKYILLIMWISAAKGNVAIDHLEFTSKEACEAAATTIQLATNSTWTMPEPLLVCLSQEAGK